MSACRTPIASIGGAFASVSATRLGAAAVKGVVDRAGVCGWVGHRRVVALTCVWRCARGSTGIKPETVEDVYLGNVVSAGLGQAPARQAVLFAGL